MQISFPFDNFLYTLKPRKIESTKWGKSFISAHENVDVYHDMIRFLESLSQNFSVISEHSNGNAVDPYWDNGWFPPIDAMLLYGFLVKNNPPFYVEVGSGNSTKFVAKAVKDYGLQTKIISIDPEPRAEIDALCDIVIRVPCEDMDNQIFKDLPEKSVVFIDNSHRCFQNSDVMYFFTDILPVISPGVIFGIHDIFLPFDYPDEWVGRVYNEQYMLYTYLLGGGGGDEIVFPAAYVTSAEAYRARLDNLFQAAGIAHLQKTGGSFWMRRP